MVTYHDNTSYLMAGLVHLMVLFCGHRGVVQLSLALT